MPLEENANIITLAAFIAKQDGDMEYIEKFWDVITRWKKYLVDNGKEPGNQLCTDDFKGHSSRNANLAVKAIMGIAAYAELCKMRGDEVAYNEHMGIAHELPTTGSTMHAPLTANGTTWSSRTLHTGD